jgi:hypothetical protein
MPRAATSHEVEDCVRESIKASLRNWLSEPSGFGPSALAHDLIVGVVVLPNGTEMGYSFTLNENLEMDNFRWAEVGCAVKSKASLLAVKI